MKDKVDDILPDGNIVLSATGVAGKVERQTAESVSGHTVIELTDLNIDAEEADVRMMIHILHCAKSAIKLRELQFCRMIQMCWSYSCITGIHFKCMA